MIATDSVTFAPPAPARPATRPSAAPFPSLEKTLPEETPDDREAGKAAEEKPAAKATGKPEKKVEDPPAPTPGAAPLAELLPPAALPDAPPGVAVAEAAVAGAAVAGPPAPLPPEAGNVALLQPAAGPTGEPLPAAPDAADAPPTTPADTSVKALQVTAPDAAMAPVPAATALLPEATLTSSETAEAGEKPAAENGAAAPKGSEALSGKTQPKAPQPGNTAALATPTPANSGKSDFAGTDSGDGGESPTKQPAQTLAGAPKNSETAPFTQTLASTTAQPPQISPHRTQAALPLPQPDTASAGILPGPAAADGQPGHTDVAIQLHNDRLHIELATRDSLLAARLDAASGQLASDLRHVGSNVEAITVALRGQTASDSGGGHNAASPQAQTFSGDQGTHGGHAHHPSGTGNRQAPGESGSALHLATAGQHESVDRYA